MQTTFTQNWIWKAGAGVAALALVVGILIYTGGYQNFLKLLGIKAGVEQSITLSSTTQFLGSSQENWIVTGSAPVFDGAGVVDSFSLLPADNGDAGLVMSIFSSPNQQENIYNTHTYETPVIDLGSETPNISAVVVEQYLAAGSNINYSYATSETAEGIVGASYVPLELSAENATGIQKDTIQLGVAASRFLRIKMEFLGDSFDARSAVYSIDVQYSNSTVQDVQTSQSSADTQSTGLKYPVVADFSQATGLPAFVDMSLYSISAGNKPVWSTVAQPAASLQPVLNLPEEVDAGAYVLTVSGMGFETQILPFQVTDQPVVVTVNTFLPIPANFDLNGDGAINTLDVSLLLTKVGVSTDQ